MRLTKKCKLHPCYIGLFEVFKRIGAVVYHIVCHQVYQGFIMCSSYPCCGNTNAASHVTHYEPIALGEDWTNIEKIIRIVNRRDQGVRFKSILLTKVLQQHHSIEEATWKREEEIRGMYSPSLIGTVCFSNLEDQIFIRRRELLTPVWSLVHMGSRNIGLANNLSM